MTHSGKEVSFLGISKLIENGELVGILEAGAVARGRRTGKTTGYLLKIIGRAMQEPEKGMHYAFALTNKNKYKLNMLRSLVDQLNLKYMAVEVKTKDVYLNYSILRGQYSIQQQKEIDHDAEKI